MSDKPPFDPAVRERIRAAIEAFLDEHGDDEARRIVRDKSDPRGKFVEAILSEEGCTVTDLVREGHRLRNADDDGRADATSALGNIVDEEAAFARLIARLRKVFLP